MPGLKMDRPVAGNLLARKPIVAGRKTLSEDTIWKEVSGVDSDVQARGRTITHKEGDQLPNWSYCLHWSNLSQVLVLLLPCLRHFNNQGLGQAHKWNLTYI